ncbi:MAG: hypothetical protein U0326_30910 [Polyangiales bacterium]
MLLQSLMADRDTEVRRFWNLPRGEGRVLLAARTAAFDDAVAQLTEREERALFPERRAQLRARPEASPRVSRCFRSRSGPSATWLTPLRGWDRGPGVRFGEGIEAWHFADAASH